MVLSGVVFLFRFLPIFFLLYFLVPKKAQNVVLLAGSLLFYAWGEPVYIVLMLFSTVSDYLHGMLGFFKYSGVNLPLPIGISFYTFQSYIAIKSATDMALGKKEINGVYLAKDGTLIEKHTEKFSAQNIEKTLEGLQKLERLLQGKSRSFQVLLAPTADNVYTANLPAYAEEYIYYGTDHHWTTLGAYYAYQTWAMENKVTSVSYNADKVSESFHGMLHSKTNLPGLPFDTIEAYAYQGTREVYYDMSKTPAYSLYAEKYLSGKNQYGYFWMIITC